MNRLESFWDVERGLEFIDTPGFEGSLMIANYAVADKSMLQRQQERLFESDPVVQALVPVGGRGSKSQQTLDWAKGLKLDSVAGYMVVYTHTTSSFKMARALSFLVSEFGRKPVFMVRNDGDLPKSVYDEEFWARQEPMGTEKCKVFAGEGKDSIPDTLELKDVRSFIVSARTFKNLDKLFDAVAAGTGASVIRGRPRFYSHGGRSCEPRNCDVM